MGQYIVSYDLHQAGRDYPKLKKGIEDLGDVAKILESVWLVSHTSGAGAIRDYLKQFADGNDSIVVMELGRDWGTFNALPDGVAFLKRHRP